MATRSNVVAAALRSRRGASRRWLEAAANGRAEWLITHNLRHFGTVPARFGVNLGSPGAALPYLEKALRCARPTSR